MEHVARKFLEAKVPIIYPGPLVLWNWNEKAAQKAKAIKILADTIPARIIPMPDYRPKYPKINPEVEINPNYPNLTIWHNKNDVCMFVGVHCQQANLSPKTEIEMITTGSMGHCEHLKGARQSLCKILRLLRFARNDSSLSLFLGLSKSFDRCRSKMLY